jgi:hypothetical protein
MRTRLAAVLLGVEDDGGRLVDVDARIDGRSRSLRGRRAAMFIPMLLSPGDDV